MAGDWGAGGELWALMLDTKTTFDDVVNQNAGSEQQARAILDNRLYRNISSALGGTQEYMAMEKLYELHQGGQFDLVVVDTPPTRRALDFLDAPARLMRFLDNRVFRLLVAPTRAGLRALGVATQLLLRTISKVVGGEVVTDTIAFFAAFEGMEQGFRDRAAKVQELLNDAGTAFVVVAAPRRDAVAEALFFADRLRESSGGVQALIVNRMFPEFGPAPTTGRDGLDEPSRLLLVNLNELDQVASREERYVTTLAERLPGTPVIRVPFLADDVHDVEGLTEVGRWLFFTPPEGRLNDPADYSSRATVLSRAAAASSIVSTTVTIRSKPVVRSNRISVGRLQATATSPPSSRVRRIPPIKAPRPAESTNGMPDMSISNRLLDAISARAWRNWLTVNASSSPTGRQMV